MTSYNRMVNDEKRFVLDILLIIARGINEFTLAVLCIQRTMTTMTRTITVYIQEINYCLLYKFNCVAQMYA